MEYPVFTKEAREHIERNSAPVVETRTMTAAEKLAAYVRDRKFVFPNANAMYEDACLHLRLVNEANKEFYGQ